MFPSYVYFVGGGLLVATAIVLSGFAGGRRRLRRALPATAFVVLLLGTAELAYHVGTQNGGGGAAGPAAATFTCSMHPQVRQDGPGLCPICRMELVPLASAGGDAGPGVAIDPVVVQNMGVRVHEVARGTLQRTVRAFGTLRAAESRQLDVVLKVAGFVDRLFADTEGMVLAAGAPLFAVYAADLVVAQEELIAARQGGEPDLLAAARQKLLLWDVPAAEVDRLQQLDHAERTLVWRSPRGGVLLQKNVVQGAPARPDEVLLRLADLSVLWLDAQVPESQLADVQIGQSAVAVLDAAPGRELHGEVVFVSPMVDARTRTGTVRIEVDNRDGALRPGMFARLRVAIGPAAETVLVPAEAVLDTGRRRLAWVAVGKGHFEPRELQLGRHGDDGMVEVRSGLGVGDRVVTSGQFLIDSESRLREGTQKLLDAGLLPGGELPPRQALTLSPATQRQADALLQAYLAVQAAMADDRHELALWRTLRAAATALTAAPETALQPLAAELAAPLQQPTEPDLVGARVAFKLVSAAAERLFELARPRAGVGRTTLYVQHCPMAEADWLQVTPAVRNPYYGSSMLECGAVRRELPLAPEGGK